MHRFNDHRERASVHLAQAIGLGSLASRYIGEQHVKEDLWRIPTAQDWLSQIKPARWMYDQSLTDTGGVPVGFIRIDGSQAPGTRRTGNNDICGHRCLVFPSGHTWRRQTPVREGNHRPEVVAHDTIRTPNCSLRHRCNSRLAIEVETKTQRPGLKEPVDAAFPQGIWSLP